MTSLKEKLPYRPCAGIMLLNKSGQVFVAKRNDSDLDAWQMPQGGIDEGESPKDGAIRELFEETSVKNVQIIDEYPEWISYNLPNNLIGKIWGGKYRGQKMKWFVMRLLGEESEIDIFTADAEFSQWKWTDMKDLPDLIVPFKRDLYQTLAGHFKKYSSEAK
jgi:putative (di)nucleoside polyphosphate hydrolase